MSILGSAGQTRQQMVAQSEDLGIEALQDWMGGTRRCGGEGLARGLLRLLARAHSCAGAALSLHGGTLTDMRAQA